MSDENKNIANWNFIDENYDTAFFQCSNCGKFLIMAKQGKSAHEYAKYCYCGSRMLGSDFG